MKPVSFLSPRSLKHLVGHLDVLVKGKLWVKVVFAMFAGIIAGIIMGPSVGWVDPDTAMALGNWLALPGLLFLAVVQMIVIPLIFSSIIRGLAAGEDVEMLKSMGTKAILYFLATTTVAIVIGIALAGAIKPGTYIDSSTIRQIGGEPPPQNGGHAATLPGLAEIPTTIVGIFPTNP
jgi:Na+/H+-dicarboxylate symporter